MVSQSDDLVVCNDFFYCVHGKQFFGSLKQVNALGVERVDLENAHWALYCHCMSIDSGY
jgi:hypothetical protein